MSSRISLTSIKKDLGKDTGRQAGRDFFWYNIIFLGILLISKYQLHISIFPGIFIGGLFLSIIPLWIIPTCKYLFLNGTLNEIEKIYSLGENIQRNHQDLNELLGKTELIYTIVNKIYSKKNRLRFIFGGEIIHKIESLFASELSDILSLLMKLRLDLGENISQEKSKLKIAKSKVSENITGTTELDKIAELQKSRLDRQIEQFEQLQRTLIKI